MKCTKKFFWYHVKKILTNFDLSISEILGPPNLILALHLKEEFISNLHTKSLRYWRSIAFSKKTCSRKESNKGQITFYFSIDLIFNRTSIQMVVAKVATSSRKTK